MAKQIYEVESNGQVYEVEADSLERALSAFRKSPQPRQRSAEELRQAALNLSGREVWQGAKELVTGAVTGAIAQPVSGRAGLAGLATGGLDRGALWQKHVEEFLTDAPEGEAMQLLAEAVGPTMERATQAIDDGIFAASGGNAELAAAAKTLVYGLPAVVGLRRMKLPSRAWRDLEHREDVAGVMRTAERQGMSLDFRDLPETTIARGGAAIDNSALKAEGWEEVLDAMRDAQGVSKRNVDAAYEAARATQAFVPTRAMKNAAQTARKRLLEEGYDIETMPIVQRRLQEMSRLERREVGTGRRFRSDQRRQVAALNELDIIRKRITQNIRGDGTKGNKYTPEDSALLGLKRELDGAIDELWEKAAISGDARAQGAWRHARGLAAEHARNFNADPIVRKMLIDGTTPEQAYRLVIGSSAMAAKPQAAAVVRRLTEILGPTDPTLVTMRKAVLRDALRPLIDDNLGAQARFSKTLVNLDKLVNDHRSLVEALDIDVAELQKLRRMAHASRASVKAHPEAFDSEWLIGTTASITAGHSIARHAAFVKFVKKAALRAIGHNALSRKDVGRLLLEGEYNTPIAKLSGPKVGYYTAARMTAAAEIANSREDDGQ